MKIITSNHSSSRLPSEPEHKYEKSYTYVVAGTPSDGCFLMCTAIDNPTPHICTGESDAGYKYSHAVNMYTSDKKSYGKVIATNNPELIADGVQAFGHWITEVEAVQFTDKTKDMVYNWAKSVQGNVWHDWDENKQPILKVPTLDGELVCSLGDYLIVDPSPADWCRLCTCKQSVFEQTYE